MLPNRKMDLPTEQNHEVSISSEPHVVVPCPTCRTKFAVEGSLVASFETPRFHCSRCDAIFELGDQSSKSISDVSREQRWVLSDDEATAANTTALAKDGPPALNTNDFSLGAVDATETITHGVTERSGLSLLGWRFTSSVTSPAAITRQEALNKSSLEALADKQPPAEPFSLFDPPSEPLPASTPQTSSVQQTPEIAPPTPTPRAAATVKTSGARVDGVPSPSRSSTGLDRRSSHWLQRLSVKNQSLFFLSMPVVAVVLTLLATSYGSYIAPQTSDAVLNAVTPSFITGSTAILPPPELSVREVSLEFAKTQSRENIGIVRGIVQNSSQEQLDDVRLEALGFNARGEIIARSQSLLRSALARERVSDLSLATVKKFQESLSARSARIDPGERVAFTIALLDGETTGNKQPLSPETLSQIKYFSARVFSVKR